MCREPRPVTAAVERGRPGQRRRVATGPVREDGLAEVAGATAGPTRPTPRRGPRSLRRVPRRSNAPRRTGRVAPRVQRGRFAPTPAADDGRGLGVRAARATTRARGRFGRAGDETECTSRRLPSHAPGDSRRTPASTAGRRSPHHISYVAISNVRAVPTQVRRMERGRSRNRPGDVAIHACRRVRSPPSTASSDRIPASRPESVATRCSRAVRVPLASSSRSRVSSEVAFAGRPVWKPPGQCPRASRVVRWVCSS